MFYPPPPPPPPAEPDRPPPPPGPAAPLGSYALATAITVAAILSQYVVPSAVPAARAVYGTLLGSFAIAYGIPIVAFALLVGAGPLRHALRFTGRGLIEGLSWYGLLTLLALFLSLAALLILLAVQPSAASTLSRPTPVVRAAEADPWLWVALSFVVGGVEETIFRGWIFGYWLTRTGSDGRVHAAWTSALFAGVHAYYALTYGLAFVIPAIVLLLDGLAFALAFRGSGGNLVGVSFVHGWNDATAFVALPLPLLGLGLHYLVVLVGAVLALVVYLRRRLRSPERPF